MDGWLARWISKDKQMERQIGRKKIDAHRVCSIE